MTWAILLENTNIAIVSVINGACAGREGVIQRQETLDLPYLTLLCDNLKNRMFLQNIFS
jgi:hypothetical protein